MIPLSSHTRCLYFYSLSSLPPNTGLLRHLSALGPLSKMLNLMLSEMLNLMIIVEDYFRARDFGRDDKGKKEQKDTGFLLNSEQLPCALCWREGTSSALQGAVSDQDPRSASALAADKPLSQHFTSPGFISSLNRMGKLQVSSFKLSLRLCNTKWFIPLQST